MIPMPVMFGCGDRQRAPTGRAEPDDGGDPVLTPGNLLAAQTPL
jgi:hypothetical protein